MEERKLWRRTTSNNDERTLRNRWHSMLVFCMLMFMILAGITGSLDSVSANSQPEVINPEIMPRFPLTSDDIAATYDVYDPDGDEIQKIEIDWYKDGVLQTYFEDHEHIPSNATSKGESWCFSIRAYDGMNYSDTNTSSYIEIENSPPNILNLTPNTDDLAINETEDIEFIVQAEDPDGDLMMYEWAIDGNAVGSGNFFTFDTDYESAGMYKLNLTVADIGEGSHIISYSWDITVSNVNRIPQVTVISPLTGSDFNEGSSQSFLIEASDPDPEDILTIMWYVDGVLAQSGGTSFTFTAEEQDIGEHEIIVEVDDGKKFAGYAWTVNVRDLTNNNIDDIPINNSNFIMISLVLFAVIAVIIILILLFKISKMKKRENH